MAIKRSFFEKLTGSVAFQDDDIDDVEIYNEEEEPPVFSSDDDWAAPEEEGQLGVDVYQTPTEIIVQAMVAGVKPEDLNITINREMVTIKGTRAKQSNVSDNEYFARELYWGAFTRTIMLPQEIESEEAEATEKYGLLTIRLPKIDKNKSQKLKVKAI